jgi:GT2 family glycosyltransferase
MVPFRDGLELTLRCLESLERQQHELELKVILINNGSSDPATMTGLRQWISNPDRAGYAVVDDEGAFNYARMHNRVIERHGREQDLLLFLNNDVELISGDCLQTLATHLLIDRACGFAGIRLDFPDGGGIQHGGITIHESNLTCGCYPFLHATETTDYVTEERVAFAVTFACAMVRREVFDRLGGLEEVLFPNSYGDVEIQARAQEMGYRSFYFGTLIGTHHESKTRGRASEECELMALHARHAQVISDAKLRSFRLSLQSWTTVAELVVVPEEPPGEAIPEPVAPAIPLRYKIADRLNLGLKILLGPLHAVLRTGLVQGRRGLRVRGTTGLPLAFRYGPNLGMRRRGRREETLRR